MIPLRICILFIFFLITDFLEAAESKTAPEDQNTQESEIIPRFEQVFDNRFLTQTLDASSVVANNAYDTLLEGVFYHLLSNRFTQKLTNTVSINEELTRQVFATGQGKYVIVDRVNIGPSYLKKMPALFQKIPVSFNASMGIDLLGIYLRSDPQRIIEKETLPTWRYFFNIWFGFIPFLERILPPSFDPNQLYDPLREVEAPISFPVDVESFKKMEIGSIHSYAFQGSVALPINLDGLASSFAVPQLEKLNMSLSVPYTLYAQGEYRINVLKKADNLAWVGLSKLKRGGHSLAGFIGTTIYLFANSLGPIPWKGVPAKLSPIDVSAVESLVDRFDQIYEFDLSKTEAGTSFQSAIAGDFTFAKDQTLPNGVRFHFSQNTLSKEHDERNYKNFILLFRTLSKHLTTKSEIKISDEKGEFYVLENVSSHTESNFNLFTGEQEVDLSNELNLNVEKERGEDFTLDSPKFVYRFHHTMKPYQLILKIQIKDRFADVEHFNTYIDILRNATKLPLNEVPVMPRITEKTMARRQKAAFFSSPGDATFTIHPTSTTVGKFSANALVVFDSRDIRKIITRSQSDIRNAFYVAYDRNENQDLSPSMEYFRSYMFYPLRLFNFKSREFDGFREIDLACSALSNINQDSMPEDLISSFNQLFKTDYPYELISALYALSDAENIPRSVTLYISPSGDLDDSVKKSLTDLNSKTFRSAANFPELERYRIAKNKLNAYVPNSLKDDASAPTIEKVTLGYDQVLRIAIGDNSLPVRKRFFVKARSLSAFKLAQENLGSKLVEVAPATVEKGKATVYEIPLFRTRGPLSELINKDVLTEGSRYSIQISTSELDGTWSEEVSVDVLFQNGQLTVDAKN